MHHYCIAGIGATFSFLHQHPEFGLSSYDSHKDGSGVAYVSTLRPQLMMRPGEGLWQFPAVRVNGFLLPQSTLLSVSILLDVPSLSWQIIAVSKRFE